MNIDKTIQDLFSKLDERKKRVAKLREETQKGWVTNCSWKVSYTPTIVNIQTVPEDQIFELVGNIQVAFNTHCYGISVLNPELDYKFNEVKIQGYTIHQWQADLKKRYAMIDIRKEESKISELNTRLNAVLSPEERRRIEVEMLAKELGA